MQKIQSDILDSFFVDKIYFSDVKKNDYFNEFYVDVSYKNQNIEVLHFVLA